MLTLPMLLLTGCDALNDARDRVDGLVAPIATQGIVLGLEAPQGAGLDTLLSGSDYEAGVSATIFLADAREVDDLANSPVTGAAVELATAEQSVPVAEAEAGLYARRPSGELLYAPEATWSLDVQLDGDDQVRTASLLLPVDHDFADQIPAQHTPGDPIAVDFTGLGYDSALIVVLDQDGVAFSNEPSTIRELYDFTRGQAGAGLVEIPGDIFEADQLYAVGVAGMDHSRGEDLDGMNTVLSTVLVGKMRFYSVSTVELPDL